ncbi:MAG: hypothetical protein FJ405_05265 [Verrucomicrobia bacterium]|nr:hypothetical protein [Verrucomicrobiota bacterium]
MAVTGFVTTCWLITAASPPERRVPVQKDFRIFDYHPGTQFKKALLRGAEAEYLANPIRIRDVTIETYALEGSTSLVARAETCLVDRTNRTARSPDPIRISLSDGGFTLAGTGFQWTFTNQNLVVSNRVESLIRGYMMGKAVSQ